MPERAWGLLAVFSTIVLASTLFGLAASGHFPRSHRAPAFETPFGQLILRGSIVVATLSTLTAFTLIVRIVPWYALIIGAGLAILAAPLTLRPFPDRFVDGRSALLAFAAVSGLLTLILALMR